MFAVPRNDPGPVEVSAYLSHQTIHPGQSFRIAVVAEIKPGFHINSHQPTEGFLVPTTVEFDTSDTLVFSAISYPRPQLKSLSFSNGKLALYEGEVSFLAQGMVKQNTPKSALSVSGTLRFQACDDKACLMPQQVTFSVPLKVVETTEPVVLTASPVFQQNTTLSSQEKRAETLLKQGLVYAVVAFFVFGLALNLTPCVYPVIPMTVAFFSSQGGEKKRKTFVLGLYYVFGIAVVFSILGLISGLAGRQWGFLFQNPWFVIGITVIILAMAASMFGAFEIRVPAVLMQYGGKSRAGAIGALVMGLTVGAVIAPCAAGIIVGLIGLVAKSGMVAKATLLFFVMGLGLGLPYLLLAIFSGLLSRLPKSGMWMVWVRKLLGFLLIGVALSFLVPQGEQVPDQQGFYLGVLAMFAGVFLGFLDSAEGFGQGFKRIRAVFGALLILTGILFVHQSLRAQTMPIDWISYAGESLEDLHRGKKPVLIDFYADWCAACRALDRKTFADARVATLAKNFVMVRTDLSRYNSAGEALRKRFNVSGLPTVVIIRADGTLAQDLRTVGFVGASDMVKRMKAALADRSRGASPAH
ncbi:MAG: thioredoxin family protein [Deltaproteobacteria bacterium]|nr:thioredoxin family protein [Deltaproteobacteria bacterium]